MLRAFVNTVDAEIAAPLEPKSMGALLHSGGTVPPIVSFPVTTLKTTHHRGSTPPQGKTSR